MQIDALTKRRVRLCEGSASRKKKLEVETCRKSKASATGREITEIDERFKNVRIRCVLYNLRYRAKQKLEINTIVIPLV